MGRSISELKGRGMKDNIAELRKIFEDRILEKKEDLFFLCISIYKFRVFLKSLSECYLLGYIVIL